MAAQQDNIFFKRMHDIPCVSTSPFNWIISKVISTLLFDPISMAAILDLCKSRILPRVATPARAGSDIYSI